MELQRLTLTLDGITASDYIAWVADPEPPALGRQLCFASLDAEPLGDTVEALLGWDTAPRSADEAARAAGLPITPEVTSLRTSAALPPSARPARSIRDPAGRGPGWLSSSTCRARPGSRRGSPA